MHRRTEWTSYKPNFSTPHMGVRDIFIHHEGGGVRGIPADKPGVLRQIESYVLNHGYIAIDYNVMVFNDGDVWAGREVWNEDAATMNNNDTSVSICAVGNYQTEPASDALINGIHQAIREIVESGYTIPNPSIRAHKEVYATACPGNNLVARMNDIKNWQAPPPKPPPQSEDDVGASFFYPANGDWHRFWIATKRMGTSNVGDLLHLYGMADAAHPQGKIENMTQKYTGPPTLGPQDPTKPVEFAVADNGIVIAGTTMDMSGAVVLWRWEGSPLKWHCIPYFPQ